MVIYILGAMLALLAFIYVVCAALWLVGVFIKIVEILMEKENYRE